MGGDPGADQFQHLRHQRAEEPNEADHEDHALRGCVDGDRQAECDGTQGPRCKMLGALTHPSYDPRQPGGPVPIGLQGQDEGGPADAGGNSDRPIDQRSR